LGWWHCGHKPTVGDTAFQWLALISRFDFEVLRFGTGTGIFSSLNDDYGDFLKMITVIRNLYFYILHFAFFILT